MKGFGRNVLSLAGGNVFAQTISLLTVPVLTRLYSTNEFGVFSVYVSIVMMIVPVSTLRFNSALVIAETRRQAENLLFLSICSVLIISAFLAIVALLLSVSDNGGVLQEYLWLIPLGVLILGFVQSIQFWVLRLNHFNTVAVAQVSESVMDRSTSIILGLNSAIGEIGLIAGRVIGPAFNAIALSFRLTRINGWLSLRDVNRVHLWQTACRYRAFPTFSSGAFFANSAAREAPVLILAMLYGPVVAGLYGLGLRVLNMPMMLIGDSLSKVLLVRIREHRDESGVLRTVILKIFTLVIYLGMVMMIMMVSVGPELFSYVFGEEWRNAGRYAAILSPAIMLMLGYRITSVLFDLYERQRQRMLFDVSLLLARIASLLAAGFMGLSALEALVIMMLVSSILYSIAIVYLFSLVNSSFSSIIFRLMRNIVLVIPTIIGVMFIVSVGLIDFELLTALILTGIIQLLFILYFDRSVFTTAVQN